MYSDGRSPYAEVALPNIVAQQPYDIWLHLVVPASESNLALGNFMATLTLASTSNNTLAVTRKPVRSVSSATHTLSLLIRGYTGYRYASIRRAVELSLQQTGHHRP